MNHIDDTIPNIKNFIRNVKILFWWQETDIEQSEVAEPIKMQLTIFNTVDTTGINYYY